ncbi:MAG: YebC/PmpR family DNA-binding transcriptional regulator [Firmicutes bacterium]|nr:YebC/PmpR family DNA-binding transcriptional regulator [Bacillota bacterium]MCL5038582.1 YebC/PmpR family DNA-binding transcriptional regulator [Bacillota bacterium]
MSGHSKWANIKHQKAKADAQKGNVYSKLAREIMVAARQGGGNPEANFRLKTAILKAREANIPSDNINRAIQRGTGALEGVNYEELVYEGYGPGGVAVLLDVMTDNRNRTAGEIRHLFSKHGGNLAENGAVAWLFDRKGFISLEREKNRLGEDEIMMLALEAGAEDMKTEEEGYEVLTSPEDLERVKNLLEKSGLKVSMAEITKVPKTAVPLSGRQAEQMLKLMDLLEDHDDVQKVYANFEIAEEEMKRILGES